ncbi:MAG: hypothetical protein ACTSYF_12670 [Promethearchaeota archaeon]
MSNKVRFTAKIEKFTPNLEIPSDSSFLNYKIQEFNRIEMIERIYDALLEARLRK